MATPDETNLIWLDLEMTGLEPEKDVILEIATIVTDGELKVLAEGPCLAVHQSDEVLDGMDPWCVDQHGKSGLTQRCRESRYSVLDAQARTLEFLSSWCEPGKSPLCGNTIGQDRRFLVKYMPRLSDFFHYRSIDVSSIKELVQRWYPDSKYVYSKSKQHLSLADVHESIEELRHYRKTVFK
ncbi:MAG TPA: oligoribonuclease [Elusimicrobia bacterium]|nr:MAG: oligoribonuclease [Elusimicrobia bacterium GWA2_66_18]OGR70682.1 MAG: oligoribonuclease [Elusimicrobia bacterium GWC2_65_9]HAZ09464.1 oligoribonuclease [Elusimicrobiota bacterium]